MAILQQVDDPEALTVVVEAALVLHEIRQHALAGVTEGRVPQVVGEDHGLRQLLVETQRPGDGARDLPRLQGVGEPVPVVVAFVEHEDLGLVLQTPEGPRVDDPIAVSLKAGAVGVLRLRRQPPARLRALHGEGRQALGLLLLEDLAGANSPHRRSASACSRTRRSSAREASPISPSGGSSPREASSQRDPAAMASPRASASQRFTRLASPE
jgi:hypothetical protein